MKDLIKSPASYGFTTVRIYPNAERIAKSLKYEDFNDKFAIGISHNGNMGNTIKRSVNPNLQTIFGSKKISIDQIKKHSVKYKESGSPNYSYYFEAILGVEKISDLEN